jgi:hypothetical protein
MPITIADLPKCVVEWKVFDESAEFRDGDQLLIVSKADDGGLAYEVIYVTKWADDPREKEDEDEFGPLEPYSYVTSDGRDWEYESSGAIAYSVLGNLYH